MIACRNFAITKLQCAQLYGTIRRMIGRDPRRRAPPSAPPKIEAVAMASAIIDFLAETQEVAGVQKVADMLGMTKSRASRHLANLELLGIVARAPQGRGYQLGWRVMRWGHLAGNHFGLSQALEAPLRRLGTKLNQTVLLCAPAGGDAIVLKCLPADRAIRIDVKEGLVLSLPHSPSARIAYAFQPKEQRDALLTHLKQRETDFRIEDETTFRQQVAAIQRDYFCWDRNKYNVGYGAVAGPVFDQNETLAGVVAVVLPSEELDERAPPAGIVESLIACCHECSRQLRSRIELPRPRISA